jgi:hypothetical protein
LINADRKSRAQRSTALTCALMAEVALGGTLLVLSGSQDPATTTVFGRVGSVVVVAAAMALLTVTMVLAVLAPRLPRGVLVSGLAIFSFAIAFGACSP